MGSIHFKTSSERLFAGRFAVPLGKLVSVVDERGRVVRLHWDEGQPLEELLPDLLPEGFRIRASRGHDAELRNQVREYLKGTRKRFELALAPFGTDFQLRVWSQVARIPFGKTLTYSKLAERANAPGAIRAVARANALNPCVLVCPCHRVLGARGRLTGYGLGVPTKAALLDWEASGLEKVRWPQQLALHAKARSTDRWSSGAPAARRTKAR
ncbi:MAG: methylated-DNA--[protein]-cysteine S-methyltransferase [Planctomycetota bacterium]